MGVTKHVIECINGALILRELGPDLHPVTILSVNSLTSNLELNSLDKTVSDEAEPSESLELCDC